MLKSTNFVERIKPIDNREMVVSFYVALDHFIDIPHGTKHPFPIEYNGASQSPARVLDSTPPGTAVGRHHYNIHATFLQMPTTVSTRDVDIALDALQTCFPEGSIKDHLTARSELSKINSFTTVVLVQCIAKRATDHDRVQPLVLSLMEQFVEHLNMFENAYHGAMSGRGLMTRPLTALENLPPLIPYTITSATHKNGSVTITSHVMSKTQVIERIKRKPSFAEINYARTSSWMKHASSPVFSSLLDLNREATLAQSSGNYLVASILIGAWSESYMQILVRSLWWESGMSPEDAAAEIDDQNTTMNRLIKSVLQQKLGRGNDRDDWSQDVEGSPLYKWRNYVADLRNDSVHEGFRPSEDKLKLSFTSSSDLYAFLRMKLAKMSDKYPLTTSLTLDDKIMREHSSKAAYERFKARADEAEQKGEDPLSDFEEWSLRVMDARRKSSV